MLENIYTTKMSADKRALQLRFSKIRSHSGKASKLMAALIAIILVTTILLATIVMAAIDGIEKDKTTITLISDGKEIELNNKPFVENNVLYLPLRELFEKLDVLDDDYSSIDWNDGKIIIKYSENIEFGKVTSNIRTVNFCYGIEIGKSEITLNPPDTLPDKFEAMALPVTDEMNSAPILKDSTTYIPWEYIDIMLSKALLIEGNYNLVCTISGEYPSAFVMPCLFMPIDIFEITMPYGNRYHPITGETTKHNGVDLKANEGTDVFAASQGTVTKADYDSEKGNYIVITDENGVSTAYNHLSVINVSVGDTVNKRDNIGKSGKTGMATGPHLHFEVSINGTHYNPELFW